MRSTKPDIVAHPFLASLSPQELEIMMHGAHNVEFEPEEIIFREGEPANRCYLIQSGKIAIESRTPEHDCACLQMVGEGDVLGWSWLFAPFSWHFQARAVESTRALALDGAHLLVTAEENHDFGYMLMRRVAQILIHRVQACRDRMVANRDKAVRAEALSALV